MRQILALIILPVIMLLHPHATRAFKTEAFVVKDSGFPASGQHRLYWLDNDRVIFTGYEFTLEKTDQPGRSGREQNIYIWDTREKQRAVYVRNASLDCYFRGYIRYSSLDGPSKKGLMGQERTYLDMVYSKDTWEGEPPEWEENVKVHPITCKSYRAKPLKQQADIVELLPDHGYLDFARPVTHQPIAALPPISFYRFEVDTPIPLPVTRNDLSRHDVHYLEFLNEYVLFSAHLIDPKTGRQMSSWGKEALQRFWILKSDGTAGELQVPVPYNRWDSLFPLRDGVFVTGRSVKVTEPRGPGDAGAYWIHGEGRIEKLAAGLINTAAISPNGCKVAFLREPHDNLRLEHRITLQLLNICQGE
ncbi:MAG TPA: hypothetical protein PKD12_00190 [Nitrospira sp.]|nr:hypothetical protein [Nitrospira sp.]